MILNVVLEGIFNGSLLALLALSFFLPWNLLNLVNLSHGSFIVILGIMFVTFIEVFTMSYYYIVPAMLVFAVLLGYVFYDQLLGRISPGSKKFFTSSILITFGLGLILEGAGDFIIKFSPKSIQTITESLPSLEVGGVLINSLDLAVFLIALISCLSFYLFINRTTTGLKIRGTIQNETLAREHGVNITAIHRIVFMIAFAFICLGGLLYVLVLQISPTMGFPLTIELLVIILLGTVISRRANSYLIPIAGGLSVGIIKTFLGIYVTSALGEISPFLLVFLFVGLRGGLK